MTTPLPIQPRPPIRGGLASVVESLPDGDWRNGVEVRGEPDGGVFAWNPLCADTGVELDTFDPIADEKPVSAIGSAFRFYPITVGKIVTCGPNATQTPIGDIARQTARGSLDRLFNKALASALHGKLETQGEYAGTPEVGASLASSLQFPAGFDELNPGNLAGTLQGLLDSVCECSHSDPIFHVPRAWMPHFLAADLVEWDEPSGRFWFGPHEVSFDCYPNEDPTGANTNTATDGSEVWIFATARPYVAMSEDDEVQVLTRRQNDTTVLVERHGIIALDLTCAWGAKATIIP